MTRILFVDDEPHILEGLRDSLRRERREWDMLFVEGGAAAVRTLAETPVDIVVCDMRMPVIDGSAVLGEARELQPEACRVVLSGQTDRDAMLRSMRLTHRFLAKPCDPADLRDTIASLIRLRALVPGERGRRAAGTITALPALPDARAAALEAALDAQCSSDQVAAVAGRDPALAANLLRLGNSAFFATGRQTVTLAAAAAAIGAEALRAPELAGALFDGERLTLGRYPIDLERFAAEARQVAEALAAARPGDAAAFAAGLLHGVGMLVLAEAEPALLAETQRATSSFATTVRERLDVTHAELGAYLLGLWGLPQAIVTAVAEHTTPSDPAEFLRGDVSA